jgi:hypothetical protein
VATSRLAFSLSALNGAPIEIFKLSRVRKRSISRMTARRETTCDAHAQRAASSCCVKSTTRAHGRSNRADSAELAVIWAKCEFKKRGERGPFSLAARITAFIGGASGHSRARCTCPAVELYSYSFRRYDKINEYLIRCTHLLSEFRVFTSIIGSRNNWEITGMRIGLFIRKNAATICFIILSGRTCRVYTCTQN